MGRNRSDFWKFFTSQTISVLGSSFSVIPLCFAFTALGHADRYLPKQQPEPASL